MCTHYSIESVYSTTKKSFQKFYFTINLLGGITLLPIYVPKVVQVSSRLRGCEECGCAAASTVNGRLSPNDYFTTTTVTGTQR